MKKILFLFIASFLFLGDLSSDVISLRKTAHKKDFAKDFYYLEDPNHSILISDVLEENTLPFQNFNSSHVNFFLSKSSYWLKFEVENSSEFSDWWIEISNGNLDDIRFYYFQDSWMEIRSGDEQDIPNLTENTNYPVFPLHINPKEKKTYYIKIKGHEFLEVPISFLQSKEIKENISLRSYILGFYIGAMIAFFIYNLILYIILKEKIFGYYALYILSGLAVFTYINGSFLNFGLFHLLTHHPNLLIIFSTILSSIFIMEFLNTKTKVPFFHFLLKFGNYILSSLILMDLFIDRHFSSLLVYIFSTLTVGIYIITGFFSISSDMKRNNLFLLSWLIFYFGVIIQILRSSGIIPTNIITINTIPIGNILSVILISISLVEKIQGYKTREQEANLLSEKTISESKKLLDETKSSIEIQISERTHSINSQKNKLEEINKIFEKEISMAAKLQLSLMPTKEKKFKNLNYSYLYKPMMGVGGDFIDIREGKKSTHIGVFICDISGHGIVASLIASMVKISLQFWENSITKPASVPDLVLKNLTGKLDKNFLTATIGFMNTRTGEFKFANAGHPPLAYLPKNKESVLLNARGKMIVEIMKPNCEEKSFYLEPGDKVVLFTDGITETRSISGEMVGEEEFLLYLDKIKTKSPEEIVNLTSEYLDLFSSSTSIEDDCTMLVFEYLPESGS
jgi:two-component system, sensor histidine kinase LadS